jgi:hypothetical protein
MSKEHYLTQGGLETLKKNLDKLRPYLQASGRWTIRDVHGENPDNHRRAHGVLLLKNQGAVRIVDRKHLGNGDGSINVYRWKEDVKQHLLDYLDRMDSLPCDDTHRVHIYNDPQTPDGKLGCKHCAAEGNHPEYSQEFIRELF